MPLQATKPDSVGYWIEFFNNVVKSWQILLFVFGAYQFWASRRDRLRADKVREAQALTDSNFQAWQVVNSAQGKGGSGGRVEALGTLVRNGQSLAGVNVDGAWLEGAALGGANLMAASLRGANLQGADLRGANLKGAQLDGANLTAARLDGTLLVGASVAGTRLSAASLERADLHALEGWEQIASINYARIDGVLRAPPGFREWAVSQGAEGADAPVPGDDESGSFSTTFRAV